MLRLALSALFLGLSAAAATAHDLRVINYTGYTITYIYMSPSSSNSWGVDRLGNNQVLPHNSYIDLSGNAECWQDLLVRYETGFEESWSVDTCTYGSFTIE